MFSVSDDREIAVVIPEIDEPSTDTPTTDHDVALLEATEAYSRFKKFGDVWFHSACFTIFEAIKTKLHELDQEPDPNSSKTARFKQRPTDIQVLIHEETQTYIRLLSSKQQGMWRLMNAINPYAAYSKINSWTKNHLRELIQGRTP